MSKTESKTKNEKYDPTMIELKWQSKWANSDIYQPDLLNAKNPFYNLMMFPYPSAEGLHSGNFFTFSGVDAYGRFKRMQGYDVFEPIGLDGFGIHSENFALKIGKHPMEQSKVAEENFYRQLRSTGNGYDWTRTVETYKPDYYQWTQWLFIELFKAGLAYKKNAPVNFCPSCKTVLADEQVIDGKCERCGSMVQKRDLDQWFFRITNFADRLLANIADLNWTEKIKITQRNWIGKKEGIEIDYEVMDSEEEITVFTTTPVNFGATFLVIAPEHRFVNKILKKEIRVPQDNYQPIKTYVQKAKKISDIDRTAAGKEKTGVDTGLYIKNHVTGEKIPLWISDFVLAAVGTGAVQGCPGHDMRDFEFAKKFGLPIKRVVTGPNGETDPIDEADKVVEKGAKGTMINSDFLNNLPFAQAMEKTMDYFEEKGWGRRVTTYHLRDWLISRQRYWGPPIPMIYCETCAKKGLSWFTTNEAKKHQILGKDIHPNSKQVAGWYPVSEKNLPVELPFVRDYKPMGTGKAPLANYPEFYETTCPHCGAKGRRETDVSDTFLDSSWYFFRYVSTDVKDRPFDKSRVKKWLPVTMYIGGAEHSVLHLLYARFVTMVLHDLGYISFEEPFARFYAHGLIIKDGAKMSKSKGNVVVPDMYIKKLGTDTLRSYLMFLGPFSQGGDFRDTGIEGMNRFLKRVWTLFAGKTFASIKVEATAKSVMHQTIKGLTDDMENLRYNTALAKIMTYYNFLSRQETVSKEEAEVFLKILAPFAPYMTEELWEQIGNTYSIHKSSWPKFDESAIKQHMVIVAIQINGKLRGTLEVAKTDIDKKVDIEKRARNDERVEKFLRGMTIKKIIYVPGKIVNFVV